MKIYIASHNQRAARRLARILQMEYHTINSSWVFAGKFKKMRDHTVKERQEIAERDVDEVAAADVLVLISGARCPGGKFIEAGVALALGCHVFILGKRENMLTWHRDFKLAPGTKSLLLLLDDIDPYDQRKNRREIGE
jgi:nucleoside 2-deoxyribosyltransferase